MSKLYSYVNITAFIAAAVNFALALIWEQLAFVGIYIFIFFSTCDFILFLVNFANFRLGNKALGIFTVFINLVALLVPLWFAYGFPHPVYLLQGIVPFLLLVSSVWWLVTGHTLRRSV
ncbi:MAG: hypothetical protein LUD76_07530 [Alistipes sp.]|nr:hypothetical protein [Alistipes sp.]